MNPKRSRGSHVVSVFFFFLSVPLLLPLLLLHWTGQQYGKQLL